MLTSILFNSVGNIALLFILLLVLALQWFLFFADSIFKKLGFKSSTKQLTKIPIISGVVSPETIPKSLQAINASDPTTPNYLQVTPSYNQSQGLAFSLSLWLNIDSQQSANVDGKVIFYKGSPTQNNKLQFENSVGLFHIDVSISSSSDSHHVSFSNPNDDMVLTLINSIQNKSINFIILIFDLNNFYKVSYNPSDNSISLQNQLNSSNQIDLSKFQVLKFAAYKNVQDVQTSPSYQPYKIGYDYPYKTPLLRFGNTVNDLFFEFNDSSTLNSYYIQVFDKNSQPYTLNFNKFFHLVITVSDNIDSSKKRTGTDIKFYVNGVLYKSQTIDTHVHFNYGNFYIFPHPSFDSIISTKNDDFPNLQLADLTYYRQVLTGDSILSLFKAGHSTKFPVVQTLSKNSPTDIKLSTQNYNNI